MSTRLWRLALFYSGPQCYAAVGQCDVSSTITFTFHAFIYQLPCSCLVLITLGKRENEITTAVFSMHPWCHLILEFFNVEICFTIFVIGGSFVVVQQINTIFMGEKKSLKQYHLLLFTDSCATPVAICSRRAFRLPFNPTDHVSCTFLPLALNPDAPSTS